MEMKTRAVNKYLYKNYLQKAEECFEAAKDAYAKDHWNTTVINAIHAAISGSDALLVFFKEVRSAEERHEEVVSLLRTLDFSREEINNKTRQLQRLLQIKNAAEYEERLMSQSDASNALRDGERFLGWVKEKLAITS